MNETLNLLNQAREQLQAEINRRQDTYSPEGLPMNSHSSTKFIELALSDIDSAIDALDMVNKVQ